MYTLYVVSRAFSEWSWLTYDDMPFKHSFTADFYVGIMANNPIKYNHYYIDQCRSRV